jgi:hypothetical protein
MLISHPGKYTGVHKKITVIIMVVVVVAAAAVVVVVVVAAAAGVRVGKVKLSLMLAMKVPGSSRGGMALTHS